MNGKKSSEGTDIYELGLDGGSSHEVHDVIEDAARTVEAGRRPPSRRLAEPADSAYARRRPPAAETRRPRRARTWWRCARRGLRVLADPRQLPEAHRTRARRPAPRRRRRRLARHARDRRQPRAGDHRRRHRRRAQKRRADGAPPAGGSLPAAQAIGVESVGKPFDPAVHEAVMREESAEVASPTVVAGVQRGYLLCDRLLRPALVRVAVPAARPWTDPAHRLAAARMAAATDRRLGRMTSRVGKASTSGYGLGGSVGGGQATIG